MVCFCWAAAFLSLDGVLGLRGWQILFLAEGAMAVLAGVTVFCVLADSPSKVRVHLQGPGRLINLMTNLVDLYLNKRLEWATTISGALRLLRPLLLGRKSE